MAFWLASSPGGPGGGCPAGVLFLEDRIGAVDGGLADYFFVGLARPVEWKDTELLVVRREFAVLRRQNPG